MYVIDDKVLLRHCDVVPTVFVASNRKRSIAANLSRGQGMLVNFKLSSACTKYVD